MVHSHKTKKRIEKFIRTGNKDFIYQNDFSKACFQHDIAYGKSKYLAFNQTKFLRCKVFKIASDPKYDSYQRGLASMVYMFFDKKSSGGTIKPEPNFQLPNELHKQIIRKLKRRKFIDLLETMFGVLI